MKRQLLLLAVLSTVLGACEAPSEGPESTTQAPIQVGVTHVRRGAISEVLAVTGETAALSVLRLASPVAGRITWLQVRAGDQLQAGAVAARVIPLENQAALHGFAVLDRSAQSLHAGQEATRQLRDQIGADHMLFGSDFPHGEGLAVPVSFVNDLDGFSRDEVRLVMRENGMRLVKPSRV